MRACSSPAAPSTPQPATKSRNVALFAFAVPAREDPRVHAVLPQLRNNRAWLRNACSTICLNTRVPMLPFEMSRCLAVGLYLRLWSTTHPRSAPLRPSPPTSSLSLPLLHCRYETVFSLEPHSICRELMRFPGAGGRAHYTERFWVNSYEQAC